MERREAYLSTNVMLSAISATLFAILFAMMAYADVTPPEGLSPATEYALFWTGFALFCAVFAGVPPALRTGARGAAGFLLATPFTLGAPFICAVLVAIAVVC